MTQYDVGGCEDGRVMLDQLMDKWTMLSLRALFEGPLRFNAIKRRLDGVTQKSLTQCLRRLERNGIVERRVIPVSPVGVEYELTAIGRSLCGLFMSVYAWMGEHREQIGHARQAYDQVHGQQAPEK